MTNNKPALNEEKILGTYFIATEKQAQEGVNHICLMTPLRTKKSFESFIKDPEIIKQLKSLLGIDEEMHDDGMAGGGGFIPCIKCGQNVIGGHMCSHSGGGAVGMKPGTITCVNFSGSVGEGGKPGGDAGGGTFHPFNDDRKLIRLDVNDYRTLIGGGRVEHDGVDIILEGIGFEEMYKIVIQVAALVLPYDPDVVPKKSARNWSIFNIFK